MLTYEQLDAEESRLKRLRIVLNICLTVVMVIITATLYEVLPAVTLIYMLPFAMILFLVSQSVEGKKDIVELQRDIRQLRGVGHQDEEYY